MKYYLFESEFGASILVNVDNLTEEHIARAVVVDELPVAEVIEGKYSQLFCRKETEEVWYEYYDVPIEEEELGV